jgi:hypothetical protein
MLTFRYLLAVVAAVAATAVAAVAVSNAFRSSQAPLASAAMSIIAGGTAHLDTPVAVRLYPANYTYTNGRWTLTDGVGPGATAVPVYVLGLGQCRPQPPGGVDITGTSTATFKGNNTQPFSPSLSLKVFDLTRFWEEGYRGVVVYVNPAMESFALTAPANAFADYLLVWKDCSYCDMLANEVWRLTFTQTGVVFTHIYSMGGFWHEVYADGNLMWAWNMPGPKQTSYAGTSPSIDVRFASPDSTMDAEAVFAKTCSWS